MTGVCKQRAKHQLAVNPTPTVNARAQEKAAGASGAHEDRKLGAVIEQPRHRQPLLLPQAQLILPVHPRIRRRTRVQQQVAEVHALEEFL